MDKQLHNCPFGRLHSSRFQLAPGTTSRLIHILANRGPLSLLSFQIGATMASPPPTSPEGTPTAPESQRPPAESASPSTSPPSIPPTLLQNDPARTGYDPSLAWWQSYFRILMGKTTPEGIFHYREDRYRVHEERDCKRCEEYRDWAFTRSPLVRFLRDEVRKLGGELDGDNVVCKRCPARITEDGKVVRQSGGFSPAHGILLCANEVRDRGHLEDSLAHEMVHAWDHLRWKVDFIGEKDLRHAACTEVGSLFSVHELRRML